MGITLRFQIKFDSDYHIGAGHGRGAGIDSALLKDGDDVPVIRGTSLAGNLRDALIRLLKTPGFNTQEFHQCKSAGYPVSEEYCGQFGTDPANICPVCRLLGTPAAPKRWFVRSARPATDQFEKQNADPFPIVQRASISPRTRRAEEKKLFSQEEGSQDTSFYFSILTKFEGEAAIDEAALWVAAARNLRELGRSRRRGQGQILISLIELDGIDTKGKLAQDFLIERFQKKWLDGHPTPQSIGRKFEPIKHKEYKNELLRIRVILRTDEPLLVSERAEAGNQFESSEVIPGQTLLGALAWNAVDGYSLDVHGEDKAAYHAFVDTFLRQNILFPALFPAKYAYPRIIPTIPAPRDMFTCKIAPGLPSQTDSKKGYGHGILFLTDANSVTDCVLCKSPLKAIRKNLVLDDGLWKQNKLMYSPEKSSELHIRIDPQRNRVRSGDLFGYVAIDRGQYFTGDLVCKNEEAWHILKQLTGIDENKLIPLHIGKAIRRGYGAVTLWFEILSTGADTCRVFPVKERVICKNDQIPVGTELNMMLLTDSIIQDPWGCFETGFSPGWMQSELKMEVQILEAAASTKMIDGFSGVLKLPRTRDIALMAGSTVRFKLLESVSKQKLEEIENWGIGLRRHEGYGQVVFNHPLRDAQKRPNMRLQIGLNEKMRIKSVEGNIFSKNVKNWKYDLSREKDWKSKCKNPLFAAVARWLVENRESNPAQLAVQIESLGEPGIKIIELINQYDEIGLRTFKNKLNEDLVTGRDLVKNSLTTLASRYGDDFWPEGIDILADQVAGSVEEKKE